ncbi:hypothetical protein V4U86_13495 [Mycobacterium sp. AMU20-3851]|uniref:hypothetical protein n=1 Tax=Mycobacterium sp. AMU20-3851 TaxID=3122055 RepID=UPI003754BE35
MSRTDHRNRGRAGVLSAALASLLLAGCGSPTVVNTGQPWTPVETPAPPPRLPDHPSNRTLADASEYYVATGTPKVYRFATPSGRWQCVIVPHASAGCRPASSTQLSIAGAPTSVPGPDGAPTAPDTIIIDRDSDVGFVESVVDPDNATDADAPVTTLPFGKVLQVAGFRCNVQELTGVSCGSESSGRGFTFSADGYTPVYTDVPQ